MKRVAEHYSVPVPEFRNLDSSEMAGASGDGDSSGGAQSSIQRPFNADAYECVNTMEALESWIGKVRARGYVAVDTETDGLDEMRASLVGISMAVEPGEGVLHTARACGDNRAEPRKSGYSPAGPAGNADGAGQVEGRSWRIPPS